MNPGCDLVQEPVGYKPISEERGNGKVAIRKEIAAHSTDGCNTPGK
jgi:hypothetical protein